MAGLDDVWLLTDRGILTASGKLLPDQPFDGRSVLAGTSGGTEVAVLVDEREAWISTAGRWRKAASSDAHLYSVARAKEGRFLVGTARARLAWIENDGLRFIDAFDRVPERPMWDTPYGAPPELRSLAVSTDGTIYANVHVGWIVRSRDGGRTWTNLRKGLDRDVHMVAAHPTDPAIVFAATAAGFHISHDHGDTFRARCHNMPYYYQRAVACFPARDVYLASTARHNGGAGALLFRTEDEGEHWTVVDGLPKVNRNLNTWQVAALENGNGLVVVNDTDLYATRDWGKTWTPVALDLPVVNAILPL